jgi:TatD DNase family protein
MDLIDTHAHLDSELFDEDRREAINRCGAVGVTQIINASYDLPSSRRAAALAREDSRIFAAVGVHPHDAEGAPADYLAQLASLAGRPEVVALGEMGLDYYRDLSPREIQQRVFREQLALSRDLAMPVVIHNRDAHGDLLEIMRRDGVSPAGGVMHCFSGSWEVARECMKMGFYISLAGPVTFKNAARLQDIARRAPLDRLLVETDAPYLTPEPHRGRRNEPSYVIYVARRVAQLRNLPLEELAAALSANARRLFNLPEPPPKTGSGGQR